MRLAETMLYVKDFDSMLAFYAAVVGTDPEPTGHPGEWARFVTDGGALSLHRIPDHVAATFEIATPPEPRDDTPIKLIFASGEPAADAECLAALGGTVIERPWGGIDVLDPEGNVIAIVAAP